MEQKEQLAPITREAVVEEFRKLKKEGVENPYSLENEEKSKKALDMYSTFSDAVSKKLDNSSDIKVISSSNQEISLDLILIDAGYDKDADNFEEVLDLLEQDMMVAEEAGEKELVTQIKIKIEDLEKQLDKIGVIES